MKRKLSRILTTSCAIAIFASVIPAQAIAQDDGPTFFQVRTVHVKPGMNGEFADLQKEFTAALKAADGPGRQVYQEVRGDVGVFYVVSAPAALSTYDTPFDPPMSADDWRAWVSRYQNTIDSSTLIILRQYPDLAISSDGDSVPNLAYLRYRTAAPGKSGEYAEWVRTQLTPHLKMGGVKNRTQSRMVMGGNNNTWVSATFLADWAEMEGEGPLDHMGDDARNAMLTAGDSLLIESENKILRYRVDLSQ